MNNYNTKFQMGQKIKVISGLHKNKTGTIKLYHPGTTVGMVEDCLDRGLKVPSGYYKVSLGWFSEDIYCLEDQIENL